MPRKKPVTPTTQALLERNVVETAKLWYRSFDAPNSITTAENWCNQLESAVRILLYYESGCCGKPGCRMGSGGLVNKAYCRECREMFTVLDVMRAEAEEPA